MKKQRHQLANKGPCSQSYGFSSSHVWTWELDYKENWVLKNDAFELWCWRRLLRVPWTARRSNPSILKEINPTIHWKNWCWSRSSNTLATWCKESTHWKRSWFWERFKAGEGDNRRWGGWMASLTQWTWVWANSRRWWRTGKAGVLQSLGSQRVRRDWLNDVDGDSKSLALSSVFGCLLVSSKQSWGKTEVN